MKHLCGGIDSLRKNKAFKGSILVILAVIIFAVGEMIGSGRINVYFFSHSNNLPNRLNYSTVNQVYDLIKNDYDGSLTTSKVLDGLKTGLAEATGDPYTEYFNPSQAKELNNELTGSFSGIGAQLGEDSNGHLEVIAPLAGTPAAKAGLLPHDLIIAVNGKSTSATSVDSAVEEIRGIKGTNVTLTILRNNSQQLNLTITRDDITVPSVNYQTLSGNIGYIQINQFTNDTSALAQKAAQSFKQANVKGVILDMRDNPGGLVEAAVNVSSLWLPQGKLIMQEKRGNTVVQTYNSTGNDILNGIPTVVLINAGSASASEITAGALHDNGVAYLIGSKSYGKGSVQEIDNLYNGGELKVTIAHWYRPDGKNINGIGIQPDQTVSMTDAQFAAGNDTQKAAAIQYLQSH